MCVYKHAYIKVQTYTYTDIYTYIFSHINGCISCCWNWVVEECDSCTGLCWCLFRLQTQTLLNAPPKALFLRKIIENLLVFRSKFGHPVQHHQQWSQNCYLYPAVSCVCFSVGLELVGKGGNYYHSSTPIHEALLSTMIPKPPFLLFFHMVS